MAARLRRPRFTLSARLLVLAAITVLPALALLISDDVTLRQDQEFEAQAVAREQVDLAAAQIREVVEGIRNLLVAVSRMPAIRSHDVAGCAAMLADVERQFEGHLVLGAADAAGKIFCADQPIDAETISLSGRGYFKTAVATGRFAMGGYAIDPLTGAKAVQFAYPYVDARGNFAGVVFASLRLDWLGNHLAQTQWLPGSTVTLADRRGTVVVALPDAARVGTPIPEQERPRLAAAKAGTMNTVDGHGRGWITAYLPIDLGEERIFAMVNLPQKQALAEVKQTTRHGEVIILASFLLALVAAAIAGQYFIERPVRKLLRHAEKLSLGDYGWRTELTRLAPEFRRLAAAFNHMAAVVQRREHQLSEANKEKNRLLAAAGHDLKQPLQVLSMAIELLARPQGSPQAPRHVQRAHWAVQRLSRSLDNLLFASRSEAGGIVPQKQVFPIGDMLREIGDAFAPAARQKKLRFSVVRSTALVESDPHLLWEVLQNLVGNAIKYTECGRILVGCRRRGEVLSVQVIDTGPGIPEHQLDAVFEEFFRLDPGSASGAGLGLAIVKRLAALLGHRIELRSKVAKGSCFAIEVGCVPTDAERLQWAAPACIGDVTAPG